jgi:predicted DNA-binding transcriptional regulator AlpA
MRSENKSLLTPEETATFLSVSPETLAQWRSQQRGPHFIKLEGRLVRYRLSDLESYLEGQSVTTRS